MLASATQVAVQFRLRNLPVNVSLAGTELDRTSMPCGSITSNRGACRGSTERVSRRTAAATLDHTEVTVTTKIDYKRDLECYKAMRDTPQVVMVPDLQFLMIDGHGDPNTALFAEATATLYPVAYKLKFASKKTLDLDFVVMPLEGLWWADDMESFTDARDKTQWEWTLMIMVPGWITEEMFTAAAEQVAIKGHTVRLDDLRLATLSEGLCVQALHIGAYDDEAELLRRIHHEFVPSRDLTMVGKHHEIYLSDARKVEPARLKTILRQPVAADRG